MQKYIKNISILCPKTFALAHPIFLQFLEIWFKKSGSRLGVDQKKGGFIV